MRSKRLFRSSLLLALAILVPLFFQPLAHASTYVGYGAAASGGSCGTNCESTQATTNGIGETVQAPLTGQLISAGIQVANGAPDKIVILTAPSLSLTTYGCGTAGTCAFTNTGQSMTVQDVEALSGIVTSSFNTITLASPVSVTSGTWVAIIFMLTTNGNVNIIQCACAAGAGQSTTGDTGFTFGTTNPTGSYNTAGVASLQGVVGGTFQSVASGGGGGTVAVTQCYGNCGSPPITLANTNSTHTINFNQTITLFYQFQSNINGFLLNVTTSMAKSYVTLPNGPAFGVYTIASCPLGQTPFSPQCPGLLQAQSPGQNFFSPPKGKISFSGLRIPVSNGQWVGIALSAFLSGLDVNDTNTNVPLFQTNEGKIPNVIQQPSSLGNSKVGLWAWINGNVVTGTGPTSPSSGNCGPGLDFILACAVNSLCTVVTSQCQTGSSIFLIVILTIFSIAVLLGIFSYWLPGMNFSVKGMGEFAILIFIGWFVAFAAYGLLLPYMIILMFFVIAWLFLGRSRGTGPI